MSAAIAIDSVELLAFNAQSPGWDLTSSRGLCGYQRPRPFETAARRCRHFEHGFGPTVKAGQMTNLERGLRVRRALLAVARLCHERSCLFPRYAALGQVIGTDGSNISRHLGLLMDQGALTLINTGCGRALVGSVRS
jgi:hypothetical protein